MRGDQTLEAIASHADSLDLHDMPSDTMQVEKLIAAESFAEIWDCSLKTVMRLVRQPGFPTAIILSPHVRRWSAVEYNSWLARLKESQAKPKRGRR